MVVLGFGFWFLPRLIWLVSSPPSFEFIYGDLCLSAHIAPLPVQKKENINGLLIVADAHFAEGAALGEDSSAELDTARGYNLP